MHRRDPLRVMPESTKPLLLLVDDDVLITETLSFILGQDFEVYVVKSRP